MLKLDEVLVADFVGGRVSGDAFFRQTRMFWKTRAETLYRRWRRKLPPSVEVLDVEQALVLEALSAARKCDVARCSGKVAEFVVWSAVHRAQREIHRMRGAKLHGNDAKNPGRPETTFSDYSRRYSRDGEPGWVPEASVRDDSDRTIGIHEEIDRALADCDSEIEQMVLIALRDTDGCPDRAAQLLFDDAVAWVRCDLRSVGHARALVGRAVIRIFGGGTVPAPGVAA